VKLKLDHCGKIEIPKVRTAHYCSGQSPVLVGTT
jgi:hypothetical protein